jgi:hypothetical protein
MPIVIPKKKKRLYLIDCGNCRRKIGFRKREVCPSVSTTAFREKGGMINCPHCNAGIDIDPLFAEVLTTCKLGKVKKRITRVKEERHAGSHG